PRGFIRIGRHGPARRPVELRLRDWHELYEPFAAEELHDQAARCMDCGIPFCHEGCTLGNLIPEWNDLVWRGRFAEASDRLHATNNFPELTGRLCPAPCEGSCVLGIGDDPVLIKQVEYEIAEWAAGQGLVPAAPSPATGRRVAVVGSGPAGLAAAQQLTRAGHGVVVFERAERAGGLLRYGVPEFKLEKRVVDRRLAQMAAEGTEFRLRTAVGIEALAEVPGSAAHDATFVAAGRLLEEFDAVVLAVGSTSPRDLPVPGRELAGIHFAMEYLRGANLVCEGALDGPAVTAAGKDVVIIGGGDTGADCLGTVHRQGARSVRQLEILPEPPPVRAGDNPWPTWPVILRSSGAHEEGGERLYSIGTSELLDDGQGAVAALRAEQMERVAVSPAGGPGGGPRYELRPVAGSTVELPAQLVLLALGFTGPERRGVVGELGAELNGRGNIAVDSEFATSVGKVFACGDAARGQSLVVWAIAEGRSCAAAVDRYLTGSSALPAPLRPGAVALA
ncbi:MAG TPA: glutamate synthase subunit beta, partial [Acidimicrobiales bacterium]|nr:glutamate synthase subunit beta [Acidimicrobiales bacterium]